MAAFSRVEYEKPRRTRRCLFTCLPEGRTIPGRFPGPAHARGKWFTLDIHCHVLTPEAEEMVKTERPTAAARNPLPRMERPPQVNREQAERNRVQFSSVEKRIADMDLMGIDIQAITPSPAQTYYSAEPNLGLRHRAGSSSSSLADICARSTPTASSGSARCRSRPPSWRSRNSTGCTNHWGSAASRS